MIRVQNIYYMLSYAFRVLQEKGYASLSTESFENTADLLAAILAKGVASQIKRGLSREYLAHTEPLSCLKGKIEVTQSIRETSLIRQQLVCTYDVFSENSYPNQIIKTTLCILLKNDIPRSKKAVKSLLLYFQNVGTLNPRAICWKLRFDRNNQTYRMLISVCYLVLNGLLQNTADGNVKLMDFLDEQRMCRLYEKFILEYYRKEHLELRASASRIDWALDDEERTLLPMMQSDIMLTDRTAAHTLIIDAKYYSQTTQLRYNVHTMHSSNLYQIFTYVKNKAAQGGEVSGMLLYAQTADELPINQTYKMSGNLICVKTLNLDCDFSEIKRSLDEIAADFFAPVKVS